MAEYTDRFPYFFDKKNLTDDAAQLGSIIAIDNADETLATNWPATTADKGAISYTPSLTSVDQAVYEYGFSLSYTAAAIITIIPRFRIEGSGWTYFHDDPRRTDSDSPMVYVFQKVNAGTGQISMELQFMKDFGTTSTQVDVRFADTWIKRVG